MNTSLALGHGLPFVDGQTAKPDDVLRRQFEFSSLTVHFEMVS